MNYSERTNDRQFIQELTGDIPGLNDKEFSELLTDWENEMLNEFYIICNICGESDKSGIQQVEFTNPDSDKITLNICKECREDEN